MSNLFTNHSVFSEVLKHRSLPVYKTDEFTFYRCVDVSGWDVYKKTVSVLHAGNLKSNDNRDRYSRLFPNEKISYWADSKATALAEIKKHGSRKNYLTFIAYDDASSTFPILNIDESLTIADGRELNFRDILLKIEANEELTAEEIEKVKLIENERPDCLAYNSVAKDDGVNFLFFEKGFKKLALREVKLYLGESRSKSSETIPCAVTCDYAPVIESYGMYFEPVVRVRKDSTYEQTEEYKSRYANYKKSLSKMSKNFK